MTNFEVEDGNFGFVSNSLAFCGGDPRPEMSQSAKHLGTQANQLSNMFLRILIESPRAREEHFSIIVTSMDVSWEFMDILLILAEGSQRDIIYIRYMRMFLLSEV